MWNDPTSNAILVVDIIGDFMWVLILFEKPLYINAQDMEDTVAGAILFLRLKVYLGEFVINI